MSSDQASQSLSGPRLAALCISAVAVMTTLSKKKETTCLTSLQILPAFQNCSKAPCKCCEAQKGETGLPTGQFSAVNQAGVCYDHYDQNHLIPHSRTETLPADSPEDPSIIIMPLEPSPLERTLEFWGKVRVLGQRQSKRQFSGQ